MIALGSTWAAGHLSVSTSLTCCAAIRNDPTKSVFAGRESGPQHTGVSPGHRPAFGGLWQGVALLVVPETILTTRLVGHRRCRQ